MWSFRGWIVTILSCYASWDPGKCPQLPAQTWVFPQPRPLLFQRGARSTPLDSGGIQGNHDSSKYLLRRLLFTATHSVSHTDLEQCSAFEKCWWGLEGICRLACPGCRLLWTGSSFPWDLGGPRNHATGRSTLVSSRHLCRAGMIDWSTQWGGIFWQWARGNQHQEQSCRSLCTPSRLKYSS